MLTTIWNYLQHKARPSALPNMAYQTSYVFNDIEVVRQAGRAAERTARDTSQDRPRNCATLTSATAMSSPAAETSTRKIGSTAAIASGADPNDINRLRASAPSAENQSTDVLYNIPLLLHGSRPFARIASQSALSQLAISRTHFLRYLDYTSALEALVRESFRRRTNWVNDQAVKELTSKVVERASQLKGHKQARGVQTSACTTPQVQIIGAATGSACIEGIDPGRITTTTDIIDNLLPDSHLLRSPPPSCSPCTLSIAHLASQAIPCHFKTLYGQFLGYVDYTSSLEELVRMLFKVCPQLLEAELMRELMGRLVDTAERLEENGKEKSVQTML